MSSVDISEVAIPLEVGDAARIQKAILQAAGALLGEDAYNLRTELLGRADFLGTLMIHYTARDGCRLTPTGQGISDE